MSLPREFLDELRTRTSLAQLVGRMVSWDTRKSNPTKGDFWAPCPFHHGSSASFHVDDRKGFYYCFDCRAKGDVFGFVRETENLGFVEAVRFLALQTGIPMPEAIQKSQTETSKRQQLLAVMELAVQHFRRHLKSAVGEEARNHLRKHCLSETILDRFEIGFALNAWHDLRDYLKAESVPDELIIACGLARPSSKGGKPYDSFRGRIMFPVRDENGNCVAFGGWANQPNNNPEYLYSPETELFDRSRTLFNQRSAAKAAANCQPLIVNSDFVDTTLLVQRGFETAVSPVGSAMTETHFEMIWRMSKEPIILIGSDEAELRYAQQLVDLALPLLEAGKSLQFTLLPGGRTKRDLIQSEDHEVLQDLINDTRPLLNFLWQRETDGREFDSPERKAALDKALREKIKTIRDPSVRGHYSEALKELRWNLFGSYLSKNAPDVRKESLCQAEGNSADVSLEHIVCECSCGKRSTVTASKVMPFLGETLTSVNALSLVPKLRCAECQSSPSYIFDDKMNQIFGPPKKQS